MRDTFLGRCARATLGQAAELPSPAMNPRLFIRFTSSARANGVSESLTPRACEVLPAKLDWRNGCRNRTGPYTWSCLIGVLPGLTLELCWPRTFQYLGPSADRLWSRSDNENRRIYEPLQPHPYRRLSSSSGG